MQQEGADEHAAEQSYSLQVMQRHLKQQLFLCFNLHGIVVKMQVGPLRLDKESVKNRLDHPFPPVSIDQLKVSRYPLANSADNAHRQPAEEVNFVAKGVVLSQ